MLPEKECEICGILFQPTRANQKYCPDCRKHPEQKKKEYSRALARSIREYGTGYEAPIFFESACKYCGHVFQINRFQLKKFCSDVCEHNWILEHTRCVNCGKPATEAVCMKSVVRNWRDPTHHRRVKRKRISLAKSYF